jgi:hypothetical protein
VGIAVGSQRGGAARPRAGDRRAPHALGARRPR